MADLIDQDAMTDTMAKLYNVTTSNGGARVSGTSGFDSAADYIVEQLTEHDFIAHQQFFDYNYFVVVGVPVLNMVSPREQNFTYNHDFSILRDSPSGEITAQITKIPNYGCDDADYYGFPVGNIALVLTGVCTGKYKIRVAMKFEASAIFIYNTPTTTTTLVGIGGYSTIPAFGVSYNCAVWISDENTAVYLKVETMYTQNATRNIYAVSSKGDNSSVIVIGAHLDTKPATPGVNDDASGISALLEIAYASKKLDNLRNQLIFAFWGAEEYGLQGSRYFVSHRTEYDFNIEAYINMDMIASANYIYYISYGNSSVGSESLKHASSKLQVLFEEYFNDSQIPFEYFLFSNGSDYGPFLDAGIPAVESNTGVAEVKTAEERTLFGGMAGATCDPCYHKACDTMDNINSDALLVQAQVVAHCSQVLGTKQDLHEFLYS
ncbi:M28 family peptidase [Pelomyxa schiedti]|nr:M28 family peptidase [Pelomyxa schiedti]